MRIALHVAALAILATGCATPPSHMMPAPVLFKDASFDLTKAMVPALKETTVPVFFATERAPSGDESHYANAEGGGVRLGMATIGLGAPDWDWPRLVASDATSDTTQLRLSRIDAVREFGRAGDAAAQQALIDRIDAQLARTLNEDLVFYVHGYRVDFEEVTTLMGSFAHYLGHGGAMVAFSWPTGKQFWNYLTDCPRAERYVPDIADTIALLANALVALRKRHPGETDAAIAARYRLGNVIFAASDVDLKTFASEHVPAILGIARQMIVYVSENDGALKWSSMLSGASRLGRPKVEELTREELERLATSPNFQAIDVSSVRGAHEMGGGMKGHGYWYANDWISTDILLSMRYQLAPAQRGLERGTGRNVWTIPPDYPQRLREAVLRNRPDLAK